MAASDTNAATAAHLHQANDVLTNRLQLASQQATHVVNVAISAKNDSAALREQSVHLENQLQHAHVANASAKEMYDAKELENAQCQEQLRELQATLESQRENSELCRNALVEAERNHNTSMCQTTTELQRNDQMKRHIYQLEK